MTTQRALAQRIFKEWRITHHVQEQMAERGIAPTELIDCLIAHDPEQKVEETGAYTIYNGKIGVVYRYTVDFKTGDTIKLIITVLLAWTHKSGWERKAAEMAKARSVDAYDLGDMLEWALNETAPKERTYKAAKKKPEVAPVVVRNLYDDVPKTMMSTARRMLRQMGLDPTDMRPVVVLGRNRIEIDPARLKRVG